MSFLNIHQNHVEKDAFMTSNVSILIADDNPDYLELLHNFLTSFGYQQVMLAHDGLAAVALLEQNTFDIIITDIKMPHMDGLQLIHHVKTHTPLTDIMVMTGYSAEYSFNDIIKAGAIEYLSKPFTRDEFQAKVTRVIRERNSVALLQKEIVERKQVEKKLRQARDGLGIQVADRTKALERQKARLEQTNTALKILLDKREQDKQDLGDQVLAQVKQLINPYINMLRSTNLDDEQSAVLNIVAANLQEIVSPFAQRFSAMQARLTPTEIKIANLIKQGMTTKDIAALLKSSPGTIDIHRKNIRKKCGLASKKLNLRSFLLSRP